ncbi:MAG: TIGR04552 family protein, partial [Bdellovibrionales bacterium]|nr:TIGR04552 family protein [Bdellovibrionales bacterium]
MQENYRFSQQMLQALAGGLSIIDFPRLRIHNIEQAYQFIRAYGYDPSDEADLKKIWLYHSRAVTYIRSYLVREGEEIPAEVGDPNTLKEIAFLFIYASTKDNKRYGIQYWACAVLRVMHVLAHLENDLFTKYSKDIQKQILAPFNQFVASDPIQGTLLKNIETGECIEIKKFETKSFKKSDSSITKLLAKKEAVALRILDKVGVRIVTKSVFDCYKVMRFLVDNHVINVANIIQSESLNSIYPIDSFLQV